METEHIAYLVAELASDRKAEDIVAVDVRGRASYTDFLVIASGTSDRHVESIASWVAESMKKEHGIRTIGTEGLREGQWALIDFGSVVLHVFHPFTRSLYQLEELWKDVPRLQLPDEVDAAVPQP